jgi:hypothetical protein
MMADRRTILSLIGFRWFFNCWRSDFGAAIADASVDALDEAAWLEATARWWRSEAYQVGSIPAYP